MLDTFRELRTGILIGGVVLGVLAALHLWAPPGWAETYMSVVGVAFFITQLVVYLGIVLLMAFDEEDPD